MRLKSILTALLLGTSCVAASGAADFSQANALYEGGKFDEAQRAYEALVQGGNLQANVFYNLGNSAFRLGQPGRAALGYERALILEPSHPEARANLNYVRERTGAKLMPADWWTHLLAPLPAGAWAVVASGSIWCALFCLVALASGRGGSPKARLGLGTSILLSLYALGGLWQAERNRSLAIVTELKAPAHFAPAENAPTADSLPAGSQVRILQDRGTWIYCQLPNRSRGWISSKAIERIQSS